MGVNLAKKAIVTTTNECTSQFIAKHMSFCKLNLGTAWAEIEKYIPQWGYFGISRPQCGSETWDSLEFAAFVLECLRQCWCSIYNYEAFLNIASGLSGLDEIETLR